MISNIKMKASRVLVHIIGILNVIASLFIFAGLIWLLKFYITLLFGFLLTSATGKPGKFEKAAITTASSVCLAQIFNYVQLLIMTVLNLIVTVKLVIGAIKNNKKHFRAWSYIHPIFLMSLILTVCMVYALGSLARCGTGMEKDDLNDESKSNDDDKSLCPFDLRILAFLAYICVEHFTVKRFLSALKNGEKSIESNENKNVYVELSKV